MKIIIPPIRNDEKQHITKNAIRTIFLDSAGFMSLLLMAY
jgi:hypothetical protein